MDFLAVVVMGAPIYIWGLFLALVATLLAIDLGFFHRSKRPAGIFESLAMSTVYVMIALGFGAWVWVQFGAEAGKIFLTAYIVEKTLSMDNLFAISLIFSTLGVPTAYQHRVLFWGIFGVVVLRAIMIGVGAALVAQFHWVLYVFGALLVATGIKMLASDVKPIDVESSPVLKFLRTRLRVTPGLIGQRFFVRQTNTATGQSRIWATPLFVALVSIEIIDLIFAVDSIPAVFAITTDPFIVYTSNIFAILGLRSLYSALAAVLSRIAYLKQALALVLMFIGSKLFVADAMGWDKFPASISLAITVGLIVGGALYSLYRTRRLAAN